ncbi:hypothetical protein KC19_5G179500 [Ceratodon purpureus]|uniref:Coilin n=1 Tax=Ceratodon purpureus TaxID=3225 RepID=A0A8T0I4U4_CERPU|nr:hypothetical protein KC19_5G179500 [Ceratodon purpureus]
MHALGGRELELELALCVAMDAARSAVRIRLCFHDSVLLSKAQADQGLAKSWYLVHADVFSVGQLVARIVHDYRLQEACPHGVVLEMSGFVLPPAQSTRILQDSDLVSVRRKQDGGSGGQSRELITNSLSVDNEEIDHGNRIGRADFLALEEFEKEAGGYQSEHSEDSDAEFSLGSGKNSRDEFERVRKLSAKESSGKKRKRSYRTDAQTQIDELISSKSRKRLEVLDPEPLAVVKPKSSEKKRRKKVTGGDHGSSQILALEGLPSSEHIEGGAKTEKKKKKKKVGESGERTGLDLNSEDRTGSKEKNSKERKSKSVKETADLEGPRLKVAGEDREASREGRKFRKRQDTNQVDHGRELLNKKREVKGDDGSSLNNENSPAEKKQPSRSARRKKAKKRWLREQKQNGVVPKQDDVKSQQEVKLESSESETSEEDVEAEEVEAEEVEAEEEVLPIMVAPGHIRFERDEDVREEGHRASIVLSYPEVQCKKQGQAWGQEKYLGRYSKDSQDLRSGKMEDRLSHATIKQTPNFEKLPFLNRAPRVGDLLAYRLVELTASWTPELSNYRVGKVSLHDATTKMISMIPVPEYPIHVQQPEDVDENGQPYEEPDEALFLPPYNSDGSLEVNLSTLMEVRVLEEGPPGCSTATQVDVHAQDAFDVPTEPLQPVTFSSKVPQEDVESAACINLNTASSAVSSQSNQAELKSGGDSEAGGPSLATETEPVSEQLTDAGWQDLLSEEINKKKLELALRASAGSGAQNCDNVQDQPPTDGVRHNLHKDGTLAENGKRLPRTNGAPIIRHRYLRTGALGPTMALLRANQVL